jgi:Uma2 family endonuclease
MDTLTQQILAKPQAYLLVSEIQQALHHEHAERQHFYEIIDENKKMEFINGEIVYHSPAVMQEVMVTKRLLYLVDFFVMRHKLGFVGLEKTLISLTRNDYEPDICFFHSEKAKNFTKKQSRYPAPELAIEILSDSTEEHDRTTKFMDYAAHGIEEYWIVDADEEFIEQYRLNTGSMRYDLVMKSGNGILQSSVLQGFNAPIRAMFDDEANMSAIKELLL